MKTTAIVRFDGTCVLLLDYPEGKYQRFNFTDRIQMGNALCDMHVAPDIWHDHPTRVRKEGTGGTTRLA